MRKKIVTQWLDTGGTLKDGVGTITFSRRVPRGTPSRPAPTLRILGFLTWSHIRAYRKAKKKS